MDIEKDESSKSKESRFILRLGLKEMWMYSTAVLIVFIVLVSGIFYYIGKTNQQAQVERTKDITLILENIEYNQTQQKQFLVSQISYGEERQRIILFIRDMVFEYWEENKAAIKKTGIPVKNFSIDRAFKLAQRNVEVAEIYPKVDALIITAIQFQESRWGILRESPVGAQGLNHIMPMTGRLLADAMGISYSHEMLHNDTTSTEMAAKYLDMAYTEYKDWKLVLAEYNGGPRQVSYYRSGDERLSPETANYVPTVYGKFTAMKELLKVYNPEIKDITKKETSK